MSSVPVPSTGNTTQIPATLQPTTLSPTSAATVDQGTPQQFAIIGGIIIGVLLVVCCVIFMACRRTIRFTSKEEKGKRAVKVQRKVVEEKLKALLGDEQQVEEEDSDDEEGEKGVKAAVPGGAEGIAAGSVGAEGDGAAKGAGAPSVPGDIHSPNSEGQGGRGPGAGAGAVLEAGKAAGGAGGGDPNAELKNFGIPTSSDLLKVPDKPLSKKKRAKLSRSQGNPLGENSDSDQEYPLHGGLAPLKEHWYTVYYPLGDEFSKGAQPDDRPPPTAESSLHFLLRSQEDAKQPFLPLGQFLRTDIARRKIVASSASQNPLSAGEARVQRRSRPKGGPSLQPIPRAQLPWAYEAALMMQPFAQDGSSKGSSSTLGDLRRFAVDGSNPIPVADVHHPFINSSDEEDSDTESVLLDNPEHLQLSTVGRSGKSPKRRPRGLTTNSSFSHSQQVPLFVPSLSDSMGYFGRDEYTKRTGLPAWELSEPPPTANSSPTASPGSRLRRAQQAVNGQIPSGGARFTAGALTDLDTSPPRFVRSINAILPRDGEPVVHFTVPMPDENTPKRNRSLSSSFAFR